MRRGRGRPWRAAQTLKQIEAHVAAEAGVP